MKTITTVYLDHEILTEIKSRGLKISPLVNNFLKSHLDLVSEDEEDDNKEIFMNIQEAEVELAKLLGKVGEIRKQKNRLKEQYYRKKQEDREKEEKGWKELK